MTPAVQRPEWSQWWNRGNSSAAEPKQQAEKREWGAKPLWEHLQPIQDRWRGGNQARGREEASFRIIWAVK